VVRDSSHGTPARAYEGLLGRCAVRRTRRHRFRYGGLSVTSLSSEAVTGPGWPLASVSDSLFLRLRSGHSRSLGFLLPQGLAEQLIKPEALASQHLGAELPSIFSDLETRLWRSERSQWAALKLTRLMRFLETAEELSKVLSDSTAVVSQAA
jgi:hypothetical protein